MQQLCKGVFWITELDEIEESAICFEIPVNPLGLIDPSFDRSGLNSKKHDNFNHEKLWKSLDNKITRNKRFDFYPRGRVEVRNRKATIYASPYICTEIVMEWIVNRFGLLQENGIDKLKIVPDNSPHYKCYLDKTW